MSTSVDIPAVLPLLFAVIRLQAWRMQESLGSKQVLLCLRMSASLTNPICILVPATLPSSLLFYHVDYLLVGIIRIPAITKIALVFTEIRDILVLSMIPWLAARVVMADGEDQSILLSNSWLVIVLASCDASSML